MKQLILTFNLLIMATFIFAQKMPDKGISSETHKNNIGKTLFSKTEVLFKKEHLNKWTTSFNWGDPIYARMYWGEGLNNIYQKNGWAKPYDTYRYILQFYANGKLIDDFVVKSDGGRTSLPLCLYPDKSDTYKWGEMNILADNLGKLKPGINNMRVEIRAFTRDGNKTSEVLSSGSFTLNVPAEAIKKAVQIKISGIETRFQSDDSWNDWKISTNKGSGSLKSEWKHLDDWTFKLGGISGSIKTRSKNDFTAWVLETSGTTVKIERRFTNDWKVWTITQGNHSITVEPRFKSGNDIWQEWKVSGGSGSMNIKTRFRSGDAWKQWVITDNMPAESAEMKMAAIFIVIYYILPK